MKARRIQDLISDHSTSCSIALQLRTVGNGLKDMDENCSMSRNSNLAVKEKSSRLLASNQERDGNQLVLSLGVFL